MTDGIIYWPALCAGANDSGLFWDLQLTLNTSEPDLTECFQGSVLVWIPAAVFCLPALIYLPWLLTRKAVYSCSNCTPLYILKLVLSLILAGLAAANLIYTITKWQDAPRPPLYILISPAILTCVFLLACVLHYLEFTRGFHTSALFFVFWFVLLLADIFVFASKTVSLNNQEEVDLFKDVTFYLHFVCVVVHFVLGWFVDIPRVKLKYDSVDERTPLVGDTKSYGSAGGKRTPLLHDNKSYGTTEDDSSGVGESSNNTDKDPCPELSTSFISNITHSWVIQLLVRGYRRPLTFDDLPDLQDREKTANIIGLFQDAWQDQVHPRAHCDGSTSVSPSLVTALVKSTLYPFILCSILRLAVVAAVFLNPLLLQAVIGVVSGNDPNYMWKGITLGLVIILVNIIYFIILQFYYKNGFICAMHARTAIIAAIYRKALRLTAGARKSTTTGEIVNLMSVDAQKIHDLFSDIHEVWAAPLTSIISMYFLWQVIGPASLAGLLFLCLIMPFGAFWLVKRFAMLQADQMVHKDVRIRLINEILAGIKVLKMYAWELSFNKNVSEVRERELKSLFRQVLLHVTICITWFTAPTMVSLVVFATYVLSSPENYLDPSKAFVSMSIIAILNSCFLNLSTWLGYAAQAYTSVKRIVRVLLESELDDSAVISDRNMSEVVKIEKASFSWEEDVNERQVLEEISLNVEENELVAVVGQVGCGKSSLIQALLGELYKTAGAVKIRGSIAYVPQEAWVQNNTLQDNILFGKPLDEAKYDRVIESCALKPDLKILPGGDQTEIGEKGINLSGGQKQRVSLARAVYQNKDIYLLDDPLSAVDAHVAKHLFDKVIGPKGYLRNKTRILVTHGLTFLPKVDKIVMLVEGRVAEVGTCRELIERGGQFAKLLVDFLHQDDVDKGELEEDIPEETREKLMLLSQSIGPMSGEEASSRKSSIRYRKSISRTISSTGCDDNLDAEDVEQQLKKLQAQRLIEEEAAQLGTIEWSVLTSYVKACGYGMTMGLLFSVGLYVAGFSLGQIWLSAWSDDPIDLGQEGTDQTDYRLAVYGGIAAFQMLGVGCVAFFLHQSCVYGSRNIHAALIYRILRAPMSFFDTTPLGRILNRFSIDMDKVDSTIPANYRYFTYAIANVLTTMVIITYSTPLFLAAVPFLVAIYAVIQRLYMAGVRQMKRIDSIRRSPIYTNFDETLVGASSIRAFRQQRRFIAKNDRLVDNSQIAWYPVVICQRWLGLAVDVMGTIITFIAILLAIFAHDSITPGMAGLSVSIAMQSFVSLSLLVRGSTELETHVVSMERIKEYSEIASEAPWEDEESTPPADWPADGQVIFTNYSTRYRQGLDYVLRELTLTVRSQEKIGIVGRTGAGKSSLALSLFRIIEAERGQIIIDGRDIADMGLHDLRRNLTIIPQDPVLFSGSLRHNLDPFEVYGDLEIWNSLQLSHLKGFVSSLKEGLLYECGESGHALSVGQRQLVCLARALLRNTKILVLDEATAAVDIETDEFIQDTIRTAFKECTVLTIAHRINTILDYDRVLVLDQGKVKEIGAPSELMKQVDSEFYSLAEDAGLV